MTVLMLREDLGAHERKEGEFRDLTGGLKSSTRVSVVGDVILSKSVIRFLKLGLLFALLSLYLTV